MEKAHHWYSAHNATWALISAWQASVQASRAVAHAERLVLLARVLELWDQVPDAADADRGRPRAGARGGVAAARDAGDARGHAFAESALAELDERHRPGAGGRCCLPSGTRSAATLAWPETMADLDRALRLVPEDVSRPASTQLLLAASQIGCHEGGPHFRDMGGGSAPPRPRGPRRRQRGAGAGDAGGDRGRLIRVAAPDSETYRLIDQARAIGLEVGAYQPILKLVIYESHLLCGMGLVRAGRARRRRGHRRRRAARARPHPRRVPRDQRGRAAALPRPLG